MIKRTLYFGNPAHLCTRLEQLCIKKEDEADKTVPIEDIGFIILDNDQITISKALLAKLIENNTAVVITNEKHLPSGFILPAFAHTLLQERFKIQISASEPLKKRLWQQTVRAKIRNQAELIKKIGGNPLTLSALIPKVQSGDKNNIEAVAAKRYWKLLFNSDDFTRSRYGEPPNNFLNYGYAILRAVIARSLAGTGLMPLAGISHGNKYNPMPLADDIMEPFRPFVDEIVHTIMDSGQVRELTPEIKRKLLELPDVTVKYNGEQSPLMISAQHTAFSLFQCFANNEKSINYPELWS